MFKSHAEIITIELFTFNCVYFSHFFSLDNNRTKSMKLLHTAVGHIGGVKDLSFFSSPSSPPDSCIQGTLFSCGSRTSLKKWNLTCRGFLPLALTVTDSLPQTQNGIACCLETEIFNPEMNPKQLSQRTGEFIDDMRFLSCDTFALDHTQGFSTERICCVCACSDGVVRYVVSSAQ